MTFAANRGIGRTRGGLCAARAPNMGDQRVNKERLAGDQRRRFVRRLLNDLRTLETMIEEGLIEEGVRRIGAEQEMFLVDRNWRPAPAAM